MWYNLGMKDSELKQAMQLFQELTSGRFELVVMDSKTNEVMMDARSSYNSALEQMCSNAIKAALREAVAHRPMTDKQIVKKEKTDLGGNKVVIENLSKKIQ